MRALSRKLYVLEYLWAPPTNKLKRKLLTNGVYDPFKVVDLNVFHDLAGLEVPDVCQLNIGTGLRGPGFRGRVRECENFGRVQLG